MFVACTKHTNKKEYCELNEQSYLEIVIDKKTSPFSEAIAYYLINGSEYMVYQNGYNNAIQFYNISSKQKEHEVVLDEEGPNGIGIVKGFYVQTLDSIFITSRGRKVIYLVNSSGKVINSYNYNVTQNGYEVSSVFYAMSNGNTPLIRKGDLLLLSVGPGGNYAAGNSISLDTLKTLISINIKTKEVKTEANSLFPKNYWAEAPYWPAFSRTFDGNRFAYSFWYSDSIYITENHQTFNPISISSKYFKKWNKRPKMFSDIFEMVRYGIKNAHIEMLIYDPFRKIYYEVIYLGTEIDPSEDPMIKFRHRSPHSIVVLNRNFEKIGEKRLPLNKYKIDNFFVGKEGLYISENNEFNPNFDENKLKFTLFQPKFRH